MFGSKAKVNFSNGMLGDPERAYKGVFEVIIIYCTIFPLLAYCGTYTYYISTYTYASLIFKYLFQSGMSIQQNAET